MINRILFLLLLISQSTFGQITNRIERNFPRPEELKSKNLIHQYQRYDFSAVWTKTDNRNILGIIGQDHQRIRIKIISVEQNSQNSNEYYVSGKSKVNGTICDFSGSIKLTKIQEVIEIYYGVDDEYADKGIKSQGILTAEYEFKENPNQKNSGVFTGTLHSKWYLNKNNVIEYDDLGIIADGYLNNAFDGNWKSYSTGKEKICNWGDFRVPKSNNDFDRGAGEFYPNPKYSDKGWADYDPMKEIAWWK